MCCSYSIICWSNTKRFLSVLIVFGKFFYFENFQKFPKLCNFVLATLPRESNKSREPSRELTQKLSWLSDESSPQSWKRFRKFSKIWVFRIFVTHFGDWFARGSSSHEFYSECFTTPFLTYSWMDLLVVKNTYVRTYVFHMLGTYVTILCNWLIHSQNALYF